MKSWNEIRKAATAFLKCWKDAYDEKSQAQSFLKEFVAVFDVDAVTNTFAVNNLNQYTSISRNAVPLLETSHDIDGNMTQCGDWTYAYDAGHRLKSVSSNGVRLVTNYYDAKSRRVRKVTPEATITFFYDDWNLIEERIAYTNGTATAILYYWGKDLSGTLQGAGGVGGLLYLTVDGAIYIPFYDNNGNVTKYLDESGNVVAAYEYDEFGRTISQSGPLADFFRHRFSTKYYDPETGLYYYGLRFYNPISMCWINRDPLEEDGSVNLTSFLENDALVSIDPLGDLLVLVLGGKENENRGIGGTHNQVKSEMQSALRTCRRIIKKLDTYPESTYNGLRDKGCVFFDSKQFYGSLSEFRKKVLRELSSIVREEGNFTKSLESLTRESALADQSHDFVIYAAHGEPAFSGKGTVIYYSDGLQDQKEVERQIAGHMKNPAGTRLFVSCYRTWDGKGERPSNLREKLTITPPTLKTKNGLRFVPIKASRTIGE